MAFTKTLAVFMAIVLISACSNRKAAVPTASEPAMRPEAEQPVQSKPQEEEPTLESVLAYYNISIDEYISDNVFANPLINSVKLDMWVEGYRRGIPGKAAVLFDGLVSSLSLRIFESHGGASYSITIYEVTEDGAIGPPERLNSSVVVKRAYDYVFGADWPDMQPVVVHRIPAQPIEELDWNPETDAPFEGITLEEAEARAKEYSPDIPYYKTVGAMKIGDVVFYIVYGNTDREALNRGGHEGSVSAVSTDGRLLFIKGIEDSNWTFVDDAEQVFITPE
jgi:hypothetical protein